MAQYLIAMGHCQRSRHDRRVATGTGLTQSEGSLGIICPSSPDRRKQPLIYGGVGRAPLTGAPYPILTLLS